MKRSKLLYLLIAAVIAVIIAGVLIVSADKTVSEITVEFLDAPVAGQELDLEFSTSAYNYHIADPSVFRWYESEDGEKFKLVADGSTQGTSDIPVAKTNCYYRFETIFEPDQDYSFDPDYLNFSFYEADLVELVVNAERAELVLSFGPIQKRIDTVNISGLEKPVAGKEPDFDFNTDWKTGFTIGVDGGGVWYESDNGYDFKEFRSNKTGESSSAAFKGNRYYRFSTVLEASYGFEWDPDDLYIECDTADRISYSIGRNRRNVYLNIDFDLTDSREIGSITFVNLDRPKIGEKCDYSWKTVERSGFECVYENAGGEWLESYNGTEYTALVSKDYEKYPPVYGKDCFYKFVTIFKAGDGYKWADKIDVTCKGAKSSYEFKDGWLYVTLDFGKLESTVLDTLTFLDFDAPEAGMTPDFDWKTYEKEGFERSAPGAGCIWYESTDGKEFKTLAEEPNQGEFVEGRYYRFWTVFDALDDYEWDENLEIIVDGADKVSCDIMGRSAVITFEFGPLKAAAGPVEDPTEVPTETEAIETETPAPETGDPKTTEEPADKGTDKGNDKDNGEGKTDINPLLIALIVVGGLLAVLAVVLIVLVLKKKK